MSTNNHVPNSHASTNTFLVNEVAEEYRKSLSVLIEEKAMSPKLVGYLANPDPGAVAYAKWTAKSCRETGIAFELRRVKREDLEDTLILANEDEQIHGIMVYYPVFGGGHDQYLQNIVNPLKDVEGLGHRYRFSMYHNIRYLDKQRYLKCILPCTPLAMLKVLEHTEVFDMKKAHGAQLTGKIITIINRSEVVGRPLAALLANDGAKVYSIDVDSVLEFHRSPEGRKHQVADTNLKLDEVLPLSHVVITGVPSATFKVKTDLLMDGVVAVNFSSSANFESDITSKASVYCPRIGKMTVVMLQRNLIRLREYQLKLSALNELKKLAHCS